MLTLNALPPRPMPTDHIGAPPASADAATDPAGFSSMLRQTQTATAPSSAAPPTAAAPKADARTPQPASSHGEAARDADAPQARVEDAAPAPDDAPPALVTGRARTVLMLAAREADPEPRDAKPAAPKAAATMTTDLGTTDNRPADAAPTPPAALDPAIAHWLAGQQRTAPSETPAARSEAPAGTVARPPDAAPAARANGTKAEAPIETAAAKDRTPRTSDASMPAPAFAAILAEQRAVENTTSGQVATHSDTRSDGRTDAIGAPAFAPAPAVVHDAAAPVVVAVPTPVVSPDFAQALGVQMSVLAKDGIQHAELHLNPAEMGPVSVQIVMDGTQARVDFGADMAATRQAIEAGLPELASALRDAGFTLAGGGVSQHAGGRGQPDRSDSGDNVRRSVRRVSDEGIARVSTAAQRAVTRGGLDLYA
ncbi:MAG: flagellar hook-length control protein FliK [Burkholderiales bacterium]